MKSIISFAVVISFVASAIAQEESPSPSVEEKASATVQESPAAAPTERRTASPAESPAVPKKEAATAASPTKEVSPAVAKAPAKKMSVEAALKDNENRWEVAVAKHDTTTVESMLASDFIGVSSKNKVQNRHALLSEMKGDKDTYTSTKNEKLDVHIYSGGVAVVVGTAREKGTSKDGKAFDKTYRFTDTWMERNGQWQCIASHGSLVAQK